MKRTFEYLTVIAASLVIVPSCTKFLTEEPNLVSPENYYQSAAEVERAVNGTYKNTIMLDEVSLNFGTQPICLTEYQTGLMDIEGTAHDEHTDISTSRLRPESLYPEAIFNRCYSNLEDCNSVIYNLTTKDDLPVSGDRLNALLAQAYANRANAYSYLVRFFGPVPLKLTPTTGLADCQLPLNSEKEVMEQIIKDLEEADRLMENQPWNDPTGHLSKGVIKYRLADMYLTMAGYPVNDKSYYKKAYDKALEVVNSGAFSLCSTYEELRKSYDVTGGEIMFSAQYLYDYTFEYFHLLGIPHGFEGMISKTDAPHPGGKWLPSAPFYQSYAEGDLRCENHAYYYTSQIGMDGSTMYEFGPHIYKYWDEVCAENCKTGTNIPLDRYTGVLLTLAEAACAGGSTTDAKAIDAYYQVRHRAMPNESKPATLTFDMVFKERMWEQCWEGRNWFTMLRTRKAFDCAKGKVVDLVGFFPATRTAAVDEDDLLLPYPTNQVRLNPNLVRK